LGDALGIIPPHCHGHQNSQQSKDIFVNDLFAVALVAAGAIRSK
jgi:hypothetical protein